MRWLFLLILSVNLFYIAWQLNAPATLTDADVAFKNNIAPIVLLSEVEIQSVAPGLSAVSSPSQAAEDVDREVVLPVGQGGDEFADLVDSAERGAGVKVADLEVPAPGSADAGAVDSEIVVQGRSTTTVETKPSDAGLAGAESVPVSVEQCFTLGPFRELERLRELTREIKSYVVSADFRGSEESKLSLHWVVIKPEKNRRQAIATGKRLKKNKIKDFYVIREGENINGISLGYFRNKKGALGLVKKVKKLGFDVAIEPVYKTYTVYWLDYRLATDVIFPESIVSKYTKQKERAGIASFARQCI